MLPTFENNKPEHPPIASSLIIPKRNVRKGQI
jgi:hypothetical protein